MRNKYKNKVIRSVVVGVFFLQLYRMLYMPTHSGPGGACPSPYVAAAAAVMSGCLAWAALEGAFWLYGKLKKK